MSSEWISLDEWLRSEPQEDVRGADGWAALATLVRMIDECRPEWQKDALCREYGDVSFFPVAGQSGEPAKEVCRRCAVAEPCLAYALENDINHGIWGEVQGGALTRMRKANDAA